MSAPLIRADLAHTQTDPSRADLEAYWMPFTANRQFKAKPRLLARSSGMHYWTPDGRQILDAVAGLWCVNAGHGRKEITEAVARQLETMDFAPAFQMGHSVAFELANAVKKIAPAGLDHVFFTNSGSEAVDSAMKIALAYHRLRGDAQRTKIISRERAYHGVNLGGTSLGGIGPNRKFWSANLMPGVDYIPHTHDLERNAFSRGEPEHGVELADALEKLVLFHDPSTIAAVFIEPIAGSTGVLVPPKGYLKRIREICTKHNLLLVFDEVITGFGRTGSPFAAQEFGVTPDMITGAKGLTNGCVPMGCVIASKAIYDGFMQAPEGIELFHGYTYSGHPVACAAGLATLGIYEREGLLTRAKTVSRYWEDAAHSLKGAPHLIDIRTYGLIAALEFEPIPGKPGARAFEIYLKCFEKGLLVRQTGDIIALSPPLIVDRPHIDEIFGKLGEVVKSL